MRKRIRHAIGEIEVQVTAVGLDGTVGLAHKKAGSHGAPAGGPHHQRDLPQFREKSLIRFLIARLQDDFAAGVRNVQPQGLEPFQPRIQAVALQLIGQRRAVLIGKDDNEGP